MLSFDLKNLSLKRKLMNIAMLTIGLTLIVSNLAFISLEYYLSKQSINSKLEVIAEIIGKQSASSLLTRNFSNIHDHLSVLSSDNTIVRSCMYSPKMQLLASYHQLNAPTCPQFWHELNNRPNKNPFYNFNIQHEATTLGILYIESNFKDLIGRIKQFLIFSVIILFASLLWAFALSKRLQKLILRPLRELGRTLGNLSKKKDYSIRATKKSDDELGDLTDLFNSLISTIEEDNYRLSSSEEKFRKLSSLAPVGIFQLNAEFEFEYVNQYWRNIHRVSTMLPTLNDWFQTLHPEDLRKLQPHWQRLVKQQISLSIEVRLQHRDTNTLWVKLMVSPLHDGEGKVLGYLGAISDITELKDAELQMEQLAFYDVLTGLANRRLFRARLESYLSTEASPSPHIALMFLDMDQFKRVNDTLGHDAGDLLLQNVAKRLQHCVSETDIVSRIGGDEFTILLTDVQSSHETSLIAEKLLLALADPIDINGQDIKTSVSIGITFAPTDATDADILMRNADLAMYRAKELGRNNYQYFSAEMNHSILENIELEKALTTALEEDQFTLAFQPKIDLNSSRITGMETLLRWQHPTKGTIMPDRFIPVAEETGQIVEIGRWVLKRSCQTLAELIHKGLLPDKAIVAVNLSARQFSDSKLIEQIEQALLQSGIHPHNLELEITESTLMEDIDKAIDILQKIQQLGISIAIDDFGTGYSSLSYIKRLPINVLKVDRSFVMDIPQDKNDVEITAAVIAMAHKLNLTVVAEGVETNEQLNFLLQNKCNQGQGYLFSRPLYYEQYQYFLQTYQPDQNHVSEYKL